MQLLYLSDAGAGRNANAGKENGVNQSTDRGSMSTLPVTQDMNIKATTRWHISIHSLSASSLPRATIDYLWDN